MIKKIRNFKFIIRNCQAGMTYVELIVVLSIFAVMTSIVLFNYKDFQARVDIKVLANDTALKIVEAQKSSLAGKWNSHALSESWKPSYGVYFNLSENKRIIYFANLEGNSYDSASDYILDQSDITKGNFVSKLEVVGCPSPEVGSLSIAFRRPDSSALFSPTCPNLSYAQITVSSPESVKGTIKIYPSGRIQIDK